MKSTVVLGAASATLFGLAVLIFSDAITNIVQKESTPYIQTLIRWEITFTAIFVVMGATVAFATVENIIRKNR